MQAVRRSAASSFAGGWAVAGAQTRRRRDADADGRAVSVQTCAGVCAGHGGVGSGTEMGDWCVLSRAALGIAQRRSA